MPPDDGGGAINPAEAFRLLRALARISSRDIRAALVTLAESYAGEAAPAEAAPVLAPVAYPDPAAVGRRLKDIRTYLGFTEAKEFAEVRLNISYSTWWSYERGQNLIVVPMAVKLISLCPGLTLDWIYRENADGLSRDLWVVFGPKDPPLD